MSDSKKIVVKFGGEIVRSAQLGRVAGDLAKVSKGGSAVVVVHGGGPQATELQKQLGQIPNIVAGRRITDKDALQVMKRAVGGEVNIELCAALLAQGAKPIGLHGASSLAVRATKRPPRIVSGGGDEPIDFGFVGDVVGINRELLEHLLSAGYLPVIACLGADEGGNIYNINADVVATEVAISLRASALFLITDISGVLRDIRDPASRIARMSIGEAKELIADGVVTRGMIPKLDESFRALSRGVGEVHILGASDLLRAIEEPGSVGTVLSR